MDKTPSRKSFVQQLGRLIPLADPENYAKLEAAFPEYFAKYRAMGQDRETFARGHKG